MRGAGVGLATLLLASCGLGGGQSAATPLAMTPPAGGGAIATLPPLAGGRLLGYAFNAGGQDVTIFDPETRLAITTRLLGATVRWLSNEQRFWDGRHIWTYDFPANQVRALAIDPRTVEVARTIAVRGNGPAHSLMLTPDRKTAWLNVAGANALAALDIASGQVIAEVATGAYP